MKFSLSALLLVTAGLFAFSDAFTSNRGSERDYFGHDKNDKDVVLGSVKETSKQSSSSQSHSSSGSDSHKQFEKRQWDESKLSTGNKQVFKKKNKVERREGGSSQAENESRRAFGDSEARRGRLTLNGHELSSTNTGSSTSFESRKNSSRSSAFEKTLKAEIDREVVLQKLDLSCMRQKTVNLYLVVHLNANWRQKLLFVRQLIRDAYRPREVEVVCVLFNKDVQILSTINFFNEDKSAFMLESLDRIEKQMKMEDIRSRWNYFELPTALLDCFAYDRIHSGDRLSLMVALFDSSVHLQSSLIATLQDSIGMYQTYLSPFKGRMCVVLHPAGDATAELTDEWQSVTNLIASEQQFVLTAAREQKTLNFMTDVVRKMCASKFLSH